MTPEALRACASAVRTAAASALARRADHGLSALRRADGLLRQLATELPVHSKVRRTAMAAAEAALKALAMAEYAQTPVMLEKRYRDAPWASEAKRELLDERFYAVDRAARLAQRAADRLSSLTDTATLGS